MSTRCTFVRCFPDLKSTCFTLIHLKMRTRRIPSITIVDIWTLSGLLLLTEIIVREIY